MKHALTITYIGPADRPGDYHFAFQLGDHVAYGTYDRHGFGCLDSAPTHAALDAIGRVIDRVPDDRWRRRLARARSGQGAV